jgi:hypothetical protein
MIAVGVHLFELSADLADFFLHVLDLFTNFIPFISILVQKHVGIDDLVERKVL